MTSVIAILIFLIPLVAIVGGMILDYQKNKLKWKSTNNRMSDELDEMRTLMAQMKRRIENLEAIAADSPGEFSVNKADPLHQIELDEDASLRSEHQQQVARLAKTKGE
jgi:hypothetical protein